MTEYSTSPSIRIAQLIHRHLIALQGQTGYDQHADLKLALAYIAPLWKQLSTRHSCDNQTSFNALTHPLLYPFSFDNFSAQCLYRISEYIKHPTKQLAEEIATLLTPPPHKLLEEENFMSSPAFSHLAQDWFNLAHTASY